MKRKFLILLLLCLGFIPLLREIRRSQLAPHFITQSINGVVVSQFWVTNPAYVSFKQEWQITSNGVELVNVPKTNYYWIVWGIWK